MKKKHVKYRHSYKFRTPLLKKTKPKKEKIGAQLLYDSFEPYTPGTFVVLTCSYNKDKYLRDWAKSVLEQTYRPLNVVFVDDCSTGLDLTVMMSLRKDFSDKNIGLRIIRNTERAHCASSYKNAYKHAVGDYFGVLDADDMLLPDSVDSVCTIYKYIPAATFIYTQFQICDAQMTILKPGFCVCPTPGKTLLDMGEDRIHAFSHWRTFSNRLKNPTKIWKDGLTCAVDKYMAYRLEELGPGVFLNKVCYSYRQSIKNSISVVEKTKANWARIRRDAITRRQKYSVKCYPIREVQALQIELFKEKFEKAI